MHAICGIPGGERNPGGEKPEVWFCFPGKGSADRGVYSLLIKRFREDYDFSIIFDTIENRKARHEMERKYTEKTIEYNS